MRVFYNENKVVIQKVLFLLGFTLAVLVFVKYIFGFIAPFVVGFILSLILNPLVDLLHKKFKILRWVSGLILIILCLVLIFVIGTSLVNRIIAEAKSFYADIPKYFVDEGSVLDRIQHQINDLISLIPESLTSSFENVYSSIILSITSVLESIIKNSSLNIVTSIPSVVMGFILTVLSAFFFIKDKFIIGEAISARTPKWLSDKLTAIRSGVLKALGGYIKAQLIVMTMIASICILGLTLIKSPYALLIGILVGMIDALPVFGLGSVFWPWILYNILIGNYKQGISLAIIYVIAFLARQAIEPKIVGEQIGLHPLLTLMSIYVGLQIFGVLGFFIGPFVAIIIKVVMQSDPLDA